MRILLWSVLGFLAGTVASYFAIMVAYSAYVGLFKIHDQDGGGAMMMGLVVAPVLALICGIVVAVVCGVLASRTGARRGAD